MKGDLQWLRKVHEVSRRWIRRSSARSPARAGGPPTRRDRPTNGMRKRPARPAVVEARPLINAALPTNGMRKRLVKLAGAAAAPLAAVRKRKRAVVAAVAATASA